MMGSFVSQNPNSERHDSEKKIDKFSRQWFSTYSPMPFNFGSNDNGILFDGVLIPEEIVTTILSYVESSSLLNCRLVCQKWRFLVDTNVWRFKIGKKVYRRLQCVLNDIENPFPVFYKVCEMKPFHRNLIKNSCGEDKLKHWQIQYNGGDGWIVEDQPAGATALPLCEEFASTSCFATSYADCTKNQLIDLWAEGLTPIILDEITPTIYVSEMYTARFDCASSYFIFVELLDKQMQQMQIFEHEKAMEQWQNMDWEKVEHEFKNYAIGARYIRFHHRGCDSQFWKGHYGSKMSRACVKVIL